jgi:hypothetical protein
MVNVSYTWKITTAIHCKHGSVAPISRRLLETRVEEVRMDRADQSLMTDS